MRGIADVQLDPGRRADLLRQAVGRLAAGAVRPLVGRTFPLAEAAAAHRAIESRAVVGKALLLP